MLTPAESAEEPTLNAVVFRRIRADIVLCQLMPDERLRLDGLRERYGVGASPIREALMRLQAEGLVELEQNKGFRVSPVSPDRLVDLMRMRGEIEAIALRWSIQNGDIDWEAALLAAFHRLSHQKKIELGGAGKINPSWSKHHRGFHAALAAACGSPILNAIREGLFDQATRYVALSIKSRAAPRNDVAEHEQIMKAALDRDAARAVELNNQHLERTAAKVLKSLIGQDRLVRLRRADANII